MERQQRFEEHVQRVIADLDRRAVAARRREWRAVAICVLAVIVTLPGWSPLLGQAPKTMEQRISDLEKRPAGVQIDNGTTRLTAPIEVYDDRGNVVASLQAIDGEAMLSVGGSERGLVTIGSYSSDGEAVIAVQNARRKTSVVIGPKSGQPGHGVFIMDNAGKDAAVRLVVRDDGRPGLGLGQPSGAGVSLGVGDTDTGIVSVFSENGDTGVLLGSASGVSTSNTRRMGVYAFGEGEAAGVSVYGDKLGGNVRVHNPQGAPVGGLFSEEEGGGLVLTDPAAGNSVVDLGVRDGGGSVRVFSVGGSPTRAALEADSRTGGVTAYGHDGKAAATMTTRQGGSGYFQLLYNGVTMVDAGMNEDNVGIVRAGPSSQKTVGVLAVPYRLVGRK